MKGIRSKENCYVWVSQESEHHFTNLSNMEDEIGKQTRLANYKLPHLATPNTLKLRHKELIESIKVAINSLHTDGWKDVERDDGTSAFQTKPHFGSLIEPRSVREALNNECWIEAMQEELNQLKISEVWNLVPRPEGFNAFETKWVFKIESDEDEIMTRNQARLVVHGDTQGKRLNLDKTFTSAVKLEAVRLLLGIACALKFKLFHMNVMNACLNEYLQEEIYVEQPQGFVDLESPNHVYKLKKFFYGLKQGPEAWYKRLTKFLINQGYKKGELDETLFVKKKWRYYHDNSNIW
jgi:hypothetical protein